MKFASGVLLSGLLLPFTYSALKGIDDPPHIVSYSVDETLACLFMVWIIIGIVYGAGYFTGKEAKDGTD